MLTCSRALGVDVTAAVGEVEGDGAADALQLQHPHLTALVHLFSSWAGRQAYGAEMRDGAAASCGVFVTTGVCSWARSLVSS